MSLPAHSKIINKVAVQILKPNGLVRKGQSRIWLDDHGWYTTMIEFQPFSGRQGTCINVGVTFHWYLKDYSSFDVGYRESKFIDYESDEQFIPEVEKLAHLALNKIIGYRESLCNLDNAKQLILNHDFTSDSLWGNYHKGIISGLANDLEGLNKYYDGLLAVDHGVAWAHELKNQVLHLKNIATNSDGFRMEIMKIISKTRALKKLPVLEIKLP
jgi:hypothetical protein